MEDGRECLNIHNVKNRSDFPPKYEELQNVLLIRKYVNQPVMEDTANQNQRKHSSFLKKENANNPVTALPPASPSPASEFIYHGQVNSQKEKLFLPSWWTFIEVFLQWHFKVFQKNHKNTPDFRKYISLKTAAR